MARAVDPTVGDGLLIVDKPAGWTSHSVVGACRRICGTRKVGHAGTLDPMATGVLVVGVNRATRLLTYLVGADKTYTATIRLGQATTTDDAEGEITARTGAQIARAQVEAQLAHLTGEIEQIPSSVSAIKVDGKRAYARVRAGEQVTLAARPVTIHEFTVNDVHQVAATDSTPVADVDVRVRCSSGTYIRALARDLGKELGVGGHLTALRRTEVGPFDVASAMTLPRRDEEPGPLEAPEFLPLDRALMAAFPIRIADEAEARALSYGQPIPQSMTAGVTGVLSQAGEALALVENRDAQAKPILVFAPA